MSLAALGERKSCFHLSGGRLGNTEPLVQKVAVRGCVLSTVLSGGTQHLGPGHDCAEAA